MTAVTATPRTVPGGAREYAGTGRLTRFALRRDRVRIPVWALSIAGLIGYFAAVLPVAYPDAASLQARAAIMMEPSGAFMTGPGYGLEQYTFGRMLANEMLGMLAVAAALMSIFLVVRHTRAEEETGRAELVRAAPVGRRGPLTAALADVLVANAAVSATLLLALLANDFGFADSLAFATGVGAVGLVFAGVAAVTAQMAEHSRTASGIAGAVLGLAYVVRGVGDAQERGGSTLSWLSPIGWIQQMRTFVDLRWEPLLACVGLALVLIAAAYLLAARRDVGAGILPARSGRGDARPSLLGVVGLAARLERGSVLGWAAGLFVFAVLTGSMGEGIVESFEEQPQLAEIFGAAGSADILRATLASFLSFFAMAVAVYAVISVNRMRKEEEEGRAAAVLATRVSRGRWLAGPLVATGGGAALLLLVNGFGLGAGAAATIGEPGLVWEFMLASLAYLPIVSCFAMLALLAQSLRAGAWWVWLLLVGSIIVGLYGPVLNLPDVVTDAAPFGLVPAVPYEDLAPAPLALMVLVAAGLCAAGLAAFRRRDLSA